MFYLRDFLLNKRGNVAMIFGIFGLPMLMLVGVGVEYSRIADQEAELQKVVDNAAISFRNMRRKRISVAGQIEDLIHANSGRDTARVRISVDKDRLRIDAQDKIDTPLLSTIGRPKSTITASTELDIDHARGSGASSKTISQEELERRLDAEIEKTLKSLGLEGNANRLSPTQRQRIKQQLEQRLKRMQSRIK